MANKTVTVTCKDGKVTIEAKGYKGKACDTVKDALAKALGGKEISDVPTPEAREARQEQHDTVTQ